MPHPDNWTKVEPGHPWHHGEHVVYADLIRRSRRTEDVLARAASLFEANSAVRTEAYKGDGQPHPLRNPKQAAGPVRNKETEWYQKGSKEPQEAFGEWHKPEQDVPDLHDALLGFGFRHARSWGHGIYVHAYNHPNGQQVRVDSTRNVYYGHTPSHMERLAGVTRGHHLEDYLATKGFPKFREARQAEAGPQPFRSAPARPVAPRTKPLVARPAAKPFKLVVKPQETRVRNFFFSRPVHEWKPNPKATLLDRVVAGEDLGSVLAEFQMGPEMLAKLNTIRLKMKYGSDWDRITPDDEIKMARRLKNFHAVLKKHGIVAIKR